MSKILISLLLQLMQEMIQKQVNKAMTQGFVSIPEDAHPDKEQKLRQALADQLGVQVAELEAPTDGSGNLLA